MTKVMKKLSSMLLAVAMVATMMPFVAAPAFAGTELPGLKVLVNGVDTGKVVDLDQVAYEDPQIFSSVQAGKNGISFKYKLAQGPSIEGLLREAGIIETSLDEIPNAKLELWETESAGKTPNGYSLAVSDLPGMRDTIQLSDTITEDNVDILNFGNKKVTPILAVKVVEKNTYEDASSASLTDSSLGGFCVGNNLNGNIHIKVNGSYDPDNLNANAKFAWKNSPILNVVFPVNVNLGDMIFTSEASKQAKVSNKLTDQEIELLYGLAKWTSNDTKVATVDEDGVITPVGIGTCTVSAKMSKHHIVGNINVTVDKSAFAPTNPSALKVKNVKKKKAQLTWAAGTKATGYEIYRSTKKNKGFKKIATVSGTNYKSKKLKKGKTYYFKVRAYRNYNGTVIYSGDTAVKKVKIKK